MELNKILIVDDDQVMATGLCKRLVKRGFQVDVVFSGKDVLSKIENEQYDLILLDIVMPEVSGLDVLKTVREKHKKIDLPIIMFSASENDESIINALSKCANDFIQKPINIDVLQSRIETHLEYKKLTMDFAKNEKLEAIKIMMATYNHEINNALAISFGHLESCKRKRTISKEGYEKIRNSQIRIRDIVVRIKNATKDGEYELVEYPDKEKTIKIS